MRRSLSEEQKEMEYKLAVMEDMFYTMQLRMQALIMTLLSLNDQSQLNQLVLIMLKSDILKSSELTISKMIDR
jgi:hypothetical protein